MYRKSASLWHKASWPKIVPPWQLSFKTYRRPVTAHPRPEPSASDTRQTRKDIYLTVFQKLPLNILEQHDNKWKGRDSSTQNISYLPSIHMIASFM